MLTLSFKGVVCKLIKLLIADSSEIFTDALTAALGNRFDIHVCADGPSALEALQREHPDVLIINLMLPCMDGLTLLQQSCYQPPIILAIVMHLSAYVEQSVAALGIDYTLISPSVNSVVLRLTDLIRQHSALPVSADLQSRTIHHLHQLGFPVHLDGYKQLCVALPLFARNPQQLLTKELYPAIAKQFDHKDIRAVERSIRKAIRDTWKCRDNATWRKYFSFNSQGYIPCPTTKEFLCRIAEILRSEAGLS